MPKATRIGDAGSHGGAVITGDGRMLTEGPPTSRVGDIYGCPLHGPNPIISGSPHALHSGNHTSRIGSVTACGAIIVTGAQKTEYA